MEKRDDDAEKVVERFVLTKRGLRERSIVNKILLNGRAVFKSSEPIRRFLDGF